MATNVRIRLKQLFSEQLNVNENEIKSTSHIQDDLCADSLDEIEMVMAVEEEFDIELSDEQVENIKTFGEVVDIVNSLT